MPGSLPCVAHGAGFHRGSNGRQAKTGKAEKTGPAGAAGDLRALVAPASFFFIPTVSL